MLINHDLDSQSRFASLLIGQPTLRRMIKVGVLAALDQRITVLRLPKTSSMQSRDMLVLVEDSAQTLASSDVQAGDLVRIRERCR
jgi:type II secretory pathway predicted ATPase ExeA